MSDFQSFLTEFESKKFPPVEKWNPTQVRKFDVLIDRNGVWYHEGVEFQRRKLVELLATVLVLDGQDYCLLSPHEKLIIEVEDVPFVITDFELGGDQQQQQIIVTTSAGLKGVLDISHILEMRQPSFTDVEVGYVEIRNGLYARFSRSAWYRLVEQCEICVIDGLEMYGLWSGGHFHVLETV